MVLDLGSSRKMWVRFVTILAMTAMVACEGCEQCGEPPPVPDASAPPQAVDTGSTEDEPEVDNTVVATEMAEADGEKLAVRAGDTARALAGEIEALAAAKKPKPRKPKIKSEPETGKLKKAQLNKVFNLHAAAMKSCYERSLKRTPGLMGKVRLEVLISSDGKVKSSNARGISLRDSAVSSCMERQAQTMNFPEPEGGALRVNKTYSFTPDF